MPALVPFAGDRKNNREKYKPFARPISVIPILNKKNIMICLHLEFCAGRIFTSTRHLSPRPRPPPLQSILSLLPVAQDLLLCCIGKFIYKITFPVCNLGFVREDEQ